MPSDRSRKDKGTTLSRMPIIISPKYTRATFMTNLAADHLYNYLRRYGFNPIRIAGLRCRRMILKKELMIARLQPKPVFICYFGHGEDDSWVGNEGLGARFLRRNLVKLGVNDKMLEGDYIIHTISCYTMNELGPSLVRNGASCYFGSKEQMLVNPIDNNIEPQTVPDFVDIFTIAQKYIAFGYPLDEALMAYYLRCNQILQNYENLRDRSGRRFLDTSKQVSNAYYAFKINRDFYGYVGNLNQRWITRPEVDKILKKKRFLSKKEIAERNWDLEHEKEKARKDNEMAKDRELNNLLSMIG